jgi:hypothetical protein
MLGNIAYRGARFKIEFAQLRDGTVPGMEFLKAQEPRWQANMQVLFKRLGDEGRISNREKFKPIENTEFWEFKAFQIRMPCYFRRDQRVVITHGFLKKDDKIRKGDLRRATNIKNEYEAILREIPKEGERLQ